MKKILISCINFNSYNELGKYLQSIDTATAFVRSNVKINVIVADNTVENYQAISTEYSNINVQVFPFHENLGYIGGATKMFEIIGEEKIKSYDYVIISNVDLTLDNNFFIELLNIDSSNIGFIAPRITTAKNNNEENPFIVKRPSSLKMWLLILMYKYPVLFALNKLKYNRKKNSRAIICAETIQQDIYAGHGSIMIFTKDLVDNYFPFRYEPFMYGEEVFLAELTRLAKLKCLFSPTIRVYNIGNVSTKFLGNKRKCHMSADSFKYLHRTFWK